MAKPIRISITLDIERRISLPFFFHSCPAELRSNYRIIYHPVISYRYRHDANSHNAKEIEISLAPTCSDESNMLISY